MGTWWYNSQSGALTNASGIQSFFQQIQSDVGLGADWHKLNIPGNDTAQQAAADAKKEFPSGATPTTSVGQQVAQEAQAQTGIPVADVAGLIGGAGVFLRAVSDGKMWRSLGWLALGVLLLLTGIGLWIGRDVPVPVV